MIRLLSLFVLLITLATTANAAVDAANTVLSSLQNVGPANTPLPFVIQTYDELNQPLTTGGLANFSAQINGAIVAHEIVDNSDGTYTGHWSAPTIGSYLLGITLETPPPSAAIQGSPFSVEVVDASISVSTSRNPTVNVSPSISVSASRNPTVSVSASVYCSSGSTSLLRSYADGVGVQGSPTCVSSSVSFTIHARDLLGRDICHGGDDFSVKIFKPNFQMASKSVVDNNDGTYTVTYKPKLDGFYVVILKLGHLPKFPPYLLYHNKC